MTRFAKDDRVQATRSVSSAAAGTQGVVVDTDYEADDGLELLIKWDHATYTDWVSASNVQGYAPRTLELSDGRGTVTDARSMKVEPSVMLDKGLFVRLANTHNDVTIHLSRTDTERLVATLQANLTPDPWDGLTPEEAYNKGREDAS